MFLLTLALAAGAGAGVCRSSIVTDENDIEFGNPMWFVYAGVSCVLVLFAGFMSGLTLGLMSLGLVELEILHRITGVVQIERRNKQVEDCVVEVREKESSVAKHTKQVVFGGNGGGVVDGILYKWMMWDDGFCRGRMMDCVEDIDAGEDLVRKAFSKM
ncbi:putative CNNM, transmembrane domain-containing protein [Helianthus annuus]|nr:putative CNNM, transmembrane domain-containing protein [Helianthus annuus]